MYNGKKTGCYNIMKETLIVCKLCKYHCKSFGSLAKHLLYQHDNYSPQKYYDEHISLTKPVCLVCFATTQFINMNKGYTRTCSHKCGCALHRKEQAKNIDKEMRFRSRVSKNQKGIWKRRKQDGTERKIRDKAAKTQRATNSKLTERERNEKYGHINKLSEKEKERWIDEIMKNTGAHRWWKIATEEEKQEVIDKRCATRANVLKECIEKARKNPEDKNLYIKVVRRFTNKIYSEYINEIDPNNLRGNEFHLDHQVSVIKGFYENIDPYIIASKYNLKIVPAIINLRKSAKSSLDINKLLEIYHDKEN